jgi:hypothetical protein
MRRRRTDRRSGAGGRVRLDADRVKSSLSQLRAARSDEYGADSHQFRLNNPVTETDVSVFELRHNIRLPDDYRHFLTLIGNGGAGPFYGIFPLGMMDDGFTLRNWRENDDFVGVLSEPFRFDSAWNDLSGMPSDDMLGRDEKEYWGMMDEFERSYWGSAVVNGAIPICHEGCALRVLLAVTGEQAGRLWRDRRAEFAGLEPLLLEDGSNATFAQWYLEWMGNAFREVGLC